MWRNLIILSTLFAVGCSKPKASAPAINYCPTTNSPASSLPLAPAAQAARPIHANGINTTWTWQLNGTLNSSYSVDVYDVDLFETTTATITSLKASGKKVVCYFSAGSAENFRPDYSSFLATDIGNPLDGWPGEKWLDVRSQNVLDVMETRLILAQTKGCDGVEPDNVDSHLQNTCFNATANEQLAFNRAIANSARSKGLSVALKNDPTQVTSLVSYYDFAVTEQCYYYSECSSYFPFNTSGKPIFNAEYDLSYRTNPARAALCSYSNTNTVKTIVFDLGLDDTFRYQCF